jgi:hypothetical protein
MKAVCWMGKEDVQVLNVPDPKILNERDAIIKITRTAICGSDLHLFSQIDFTKIKDLRLGLSAASLLFVCMSFYGFKTILRHSFFSVLKFL